MVNLEGKSVLMVIAHSGFRDEEFQEPYNILTKAGARVTIASSSLEEATGMLGKRVKPDILLSKANIDEYNAIVFVGGVGSSEYFNNSVALNLVKSAYGKGKVIAAICIAPSTLANAGILEGKRVTSYLSEKSNLEASGAVYTGRNVEVDGNIITAKGPEVAREFGNKIVEILSQV
ncbi:MAG: DJ-1/PfpI family protein [Candidatus Aenigmarchaeota archaeon]|nr:DJ-1/PfpI family protein [Candidatus Aenigmarchaeota archaeon]